VQRDNQSIKFAERLILPKIEKCHSNLLDKCKNRKLVAFATCFLILKLVAGIELAVSLQFSPPTESVETSRYIRRIILDGNSALSDNDLAELLDMEPGDRFDPHLVSSAIPRILEEYKELGYMFAKVEWEIRPAESNQVHLYVKIHEGQLIKLGKIKLRGNSIFTQDQILRELDFHRSSVFDESVFQSDMENLIRIYSERGYPLVKVSPSEFNIEDGNLNIVIEIEEGPLVRIDEIRIDGLKKTKKEVILREIPIQPGDVFHQAKIDESKRLLDNLGYFQSATRYSFSKAVGDNAILIFHVNEARTGQFSGVLGYNPSENEIGGQRFTGTIEASESNIMGTGRQMAVRGRFGLTDAYELLYTEPFIFNTPLDLGVRIWGTSQESQDIRFKTQDMRFEDEPDLGFESLRELAFSFTASTRVIRLVEGSVSVAYKSIESSSDMENIPLELSEENITGSKYSVAFALQRDSRDYFANPLSGRLDHISIDVSRGDFKTVKLELDINQYFRTWRRQVFALGIHGARIWGDNIPPTEILRLGGAKTLRGYGEDFFRGEGRIYANSEYRILVSRDSQFFLFLDGGTVYNIESKFEPLKIGYGVGMRLRSETGLVSVDYGLARGDSILSGKIHVSLGATF
jgi:outer membrane protein insertion porin family